MRLFASELLESRGKSDCCLMNPSSINEDWIREQEDRYQGRNPIFMNRNNNKMVREEEMELSPVEKYDPTRLGRMNKNLSKRTGHLLHNKLNESGNFLLSNGSNLKQHRHYEYHLIILIGLVLACLVVDFDHYHDYHSSLVPSNGLQQALPRCATFERWCSSSWFNFGFIKLAQAKPRGFFHDKEGKFLYRLSRPSPGHIIVIDDRHKDCAERNNNNKTSSSTSASDQQASDHNNHNSNNQPQASLLNSQTIIPQPVQLIAPARFALASGQSGGAPASLANQHQASVGRSDSSSLSTALAIPVYHQGAQGHGQGSVVSASQQQPIQVVPLVQYAVLDPRQAAAATHINQPQFQSQISQFQAPVGATALRAPSSGGFPSMDMMIGPSGYFDPVGSPTKQIGMTSRQLFGSGSGGSSTINSNGYSDAQIMRSLFQDQSLAFPGYQDAMIGSVDSISPPRESFDGGPSQLIEDQFLGQPARSSSSAAWNPGHNTQVDTQEKRELRRPSRLNSNLMSHFNHQTEEELEDYDSSSTRDQIDRDAPGPPLSPLQNLGSRASSYSQVSSMMSNEKSSRSREPAARAFALGRSSGASSSRNSISSNNNNEDSGLSNPSLKQLKAYTFADTNASDPESNHHQSDNSDNRVIIRRPMLKQTRRNANKNSKHQASKLNSQVAATVKSLGQGTGNLGSTAPVEIDSDLKSSQYWNKYRDQFELI